MLFKITAAFGLTVCIATASFAQKSFTRTGFYIGPNLGGTYNTVNFSKLTPGSSSSFSSGGVTYTFNDAEFDQVSDLFVPGRGVVIVPGTTRYIPASKSNKLNFTGGVQAGYRRQFNKWLGIIEGDFNYMPYKAIYGYDSIMPPTALTYSSPFGFHRTVTSNLDGSIRAGAGYPLQNGLIYLTAGAAFEGMKINSMDYYGISYWPNPPPDAPAKHPTPQQFNFVTSHDNLHQTPFGIGFSIGLGYDFSISGNMQLSIEYRYSRVSKTFTSNYSNPGGNGNDSSYIFAQTYNPGTQTPIYNEIAPNNQKITFTTNQLTARLNIFPDGMMNGSKKGRKK